MRVIRLSQSSSVQIGLKFISTKFHALLNCVYSILVYIDIGKKIIRAERTGKWKDHLIAVNRMLNTFPATVHFQYAKSARLYLEMMLNLPEKYPWLYDQCCQHGFHTIRKAYRYWARIRLT